MLGLVADIGGTHARFALARYDGEVSEIMHAKILQAADYASPEEAAQAYLQMVGKPEDMRSAVIACAGPIVAGAVSFVNISWRTTEETFAAHVGLRTVHLINDLAAAAWSVPALTEQDLQWIGAQRPAAQANAIAVLGVGTGCNAACSSQGVVFAGEFGHTGFAPTTELEVELWRRITANHGRTSVERLLSGHGLLHIYHALCRIDATEPRFDAPEQITSEAGRADPRASRAIAAFASVLASVSGDVTLAFGAFGGLYLTGGLPAIPSLIGPHTEFRRRFEDKGRMQKLLETVPVAIITHPTPALLGAMRALRQSISKQQEGVLF